MAQWYGVDDPLGLPWRRMRVLLQNLPYESRVMHIVRSVVNDDDVDGGLPSWYRDLHPEVSPRSVMSDTEWLSKQRR